jgi:hypothetical protein
LRPNLPSATSRSWIRVRAPARLPALSVEGAGDLEIHVDPDQIHELERAHREAPVLAHDAVDLGVAGDPLAEDPKRLEGERPVAAIDHEPR